jgi:branched-subunit amino acid aminotransferase/4-amino-4-deoxychorismate lyase
MENILLKKSYLHKDLKEINFKDLWDTHGVFTTMWIFGKPAKILFFKKHIKNLIRSIKIYKINSKNIEKKILKIIKFNLRSNKNYNHLLRIAVNNKVISFSLRKRLKPKLKFDIKLINYKREQSEFKNLKYKKILNHLSKINTSNSDIFLCVNKKILESATSNILFVKKNKIFSPIKNFYRGITFKFFEKKVDKIIKKNIFINTLNNYDEIILIGSGKGVVSVESIKKPKWERKSLRTYRFLSKIYNRAVTKCPLYNG